MHSSEMDACWITGQGHVMCPFEGFTQEQAPLHRIDVHAACSTDMKGMADDFVCSITKVFPTQSVRVHYFDFPPGLPQGVRYIYALKKKVAMCLDILRKASNVCLFSDVDIQFFTNRDSIWSEAFTRFLDDGSLEIAMCPERDPEVNAGFILVKPNARTIRLYEAVVNVMGSFPSLEALQKRYSIGDQEVFNELLGSGQAWLPRVWRIPREYFILGPIWPHPTSKALFHHAVAAGSTQGKYEQMRAMCTSKDVTCSACFNKR